MLNLNKGGVELIHNTFKIQLYCNIIIIHSEDYVLVLLDWVDYLYFSLYMGCRINITPIQH